MENFQISILQKYRTQTLRRQSEGNKRTPVPESLFYLMLRDATKTSLFLLLYVSGEIVCQIEVMCDASSSIDANTWVNAKETSKVGTLTKS